LPYSLAVTRSNASVEKVVPAFEKTFEKFLKQEAGAKTKRPVR
jgi:hypothetical protein